MDKAPVPTTPSQPPVLKEGPTVVDSGAKKLYPSLYINTLGIRIFQCSVCESTFRNHEQLMFTFIRNTQKWNMAHAPSVASLLGMVTAFGLIPRSTSEIFKKIFYTIFCAFPFCNIFTLWFPHGCEYPGPWNNYLDSKFKKKYCMYHNFVFCEGAALFY